jgi:hypothetical protein
LAVVFRAYLSLFIAARSFDIHRRVVLSGPGSVRLLPTAVLSLRHPIDLVFTLD